MTTLVARRTRAPQAGQQEAGNVAVTHFRLMVLLLLFLAGVALITMKIAYLAVAAQPAARGGVASRAARADLVDRNGMVLARTIEAWTIGIHPRRMRADPVADPAYVASELARLMPERTEAQYRAIIASDRAFVYLRRRAMPALVKAVNAIGEPGIGFAREPERLYPEGTLASHVLGWVDEDGVAGSGMEYALDARLTDRARLATPVALSLDARVQAALEAELSIAVAKHSAVGASGIILDVDTGEVVAMTSLPHYNPNERRSATPEALSNKATLSVYELGSTFKAITAAAALETGVVDTLGKRYDATAPLRVGGFRIRDDHPENRWMNLPEMMVHSSNIVTARIAEEIGPARMQAMFRRLGFDTKPDIELGAKGMPLWPTFWARTTTMTVGYGHGIAVTPLHLASAYAALVNGGVWRPATLLKRAPDEVPAGRRVISERTSLTVRKLMRLVVTEGTGRKAEAPGMRLAGKTGTADKAQGGGYNRRARVSTFAGVFPIDAPRYAVVVMLDDPKGTADTYGFATAAWTAGPVISRVVSRVGPMLGVIPDMHRDIDLSDVQPLIWKPEARRE